MRGQMDEAIMSFEEMQAHYPDEWVLVQDPQVDQSGQILSGKVIAHDVDSDKVYEVGLKVRPFHFAMLCFKTIPEGTALAL